MSENWKLTAKATRAEIEAALTAHEEKDWENDFVLSGREISEKPDVWMLEAWLPHRPRSMERNRFARLFAGRTPEITEEKLPDTDWVTHSQQAAAPIRAGRFHVRTPDFPPTREQGVVDFSIPAAQAFGTGQHETTSGCLIVLDAMKRRGIRARNIADIGTGTGLLAFAALKLWPRAHCIASDNDAVCLPAVEHNAALNTVPLGEGPGRLRMVVAEGMEHDELLAREPYDLLIANILAGPLIDLAPDFAEAVAPRGNIVLAGLLERQERAVRSAYRRAGFAPRGRLVRGDWSILWLRRRFSA